MEKKDWQGIIDDAKNKYELEWPQDQEELEDDPNFQAMWEELGGNKIKKEQKGIQKKKVKVEIPQKEKVEEQEQKLEVA